MRNDMSLQLHSLFTDHAVLQHGVAVPVWGTAAPRQRIVVGMAAQHVFAVVDAQGNWKAWFKPLQAGGPHLLHVATDAGESIEIRDVLVGDVYLCSGQSNMEWPVSGAVNGSAECAAADFPQIRLFQVPKRTAAAPRTDVDATWAVCSPETAANFSAVGYFFGREIHQTQRVPVGLINASWGGTVCEAWTSGPALTSNPALLPIADRLRAAATKDTDPEIMERHIRALRAWETEFCYADPGNQGEGRGWASASFDDTNWDTMTIPTAWERTGLNIDGAVWFRRDVTIPPTWKGRDATLSLGTVDDFDDTYINGVRIGGIDVRTPDAWAIPRMYAVPASLLKPGRNVLAIRVFDRINDGGIIGPASQLKLSAGDGESIPLAGEWRYKIELRLEPKQGVPPPPVGPLGFENQNCPTALFNGMIHPLIPYALRGVIWYQGESNRDRAAQYRTLFPAMIQDWRDNWGIGDFPFFFVELARWNGRQELPTDSELAELRKLRHARWHHVPSAARRSSTPATRWIFIQSISRPSAIASRWRLVLWYTANRSNQPGRRTPQ